jgi:hypothetical protein
MFLREVNNRQRGGTLTNFQVLPYRVGIRFDVIVITQRSGVDHKALAESGQIHHETELLVT